MQPFEKFLEGIPWPIKAMLIFGGSLMSAFSSKFPDGLQTSGLYVGLALAVIGANALMWHASRSNGRAKMMIGVGILIFSCALGMLGMSMIAAGGASQFAKRIGVGGSHSVFRYEKSAFVQSRSIKWSDGTKSDLYETAFYLPIWNALDTGKSLKNVTARIYLPYGAEPLLARIKETGSYSTDIRHGEVVLSEIGRIISSDPIMPNGFVTFADTDREKYQGWRPEHGNTFEVVAPEGKSGYGIGSARPDKKMSDLPLSATISADDQVSLRIHIILDLGNRPTVKFAEISD